MYISDLFTQILKILPWLLTSYRTKCRLLCMIYRELLSLGPAYRIWLTSYSRLVIPLLSTCIELPLLSEYSRLFLALMILHMLFLLSGMPFPLSDRRVTVCFSRYNSKWCPPPLPHMLSPLSSVCSQCSNWTLKEYKIPQSV